MSKCDWEAMWKYYQSEADQYREFAKENPNHRESALIKADGYQRQANLCKKQFDKFGIVERNSYNKFKKVIKCLHCQGTKIDTWIHMDKWGDGQGYCFDCELFFLFKPK